MVSRGDNVDGPRSGGAPLPGRREPASGGTGNLRELRDARQGARDRLAAAFAEDLIDSDELDRRLGVLVDATTHEQIEGLTVDVDPPSAELARLEPAPATAVSRVEDVPTAGEISAILGEARRRGAWTPARFNSVRTILASAEIDLREAALTPGETVFELALVLGEVTFIVPPNVPVLSDLSLVLASLDEDEESGEETSRSTIRLTGHAVLGEVRIARRHGGESKRDARRRRRAERKARRRARKALPAAR